MLSVHYMLRGPARSHMLRGPARSYMLRGPARSLMLRGPARVFFSVERGFRDVSIEMVIQGLCLLVRVESY